MIRRMKSDDKKEKEKTNNISFKDNQQDRDTGSVNLTLSSNHPVYPCAPAKGRAHAYTQNCALIHRESPEDAHARAQQHTHLYNYFLTCLNNDSEQQ